MNRQLAELIEGMVRYDAEAPARIRHFLKVHAYAAYIAAREELPPRLCETVEVAAVVHDIGIREAMRLYGRSDGALQERLGPPVAEEMLRARGYDEETVNRVSYLVAHHHTYGETLEAGGADYRILVEADFLVNLDESHAAPSAVREAYDRIFRTACGRALCRTLFPAAQLREVRGKSHA